MKKKKLKNECKEMCEQFNGDFASHALNYSSFVMEFIERNKEILSRNDTEDLKASSMVLFELSTSLSTLLGVQPLVQITETKVGGRVNCKIEYHGSLTKKVNQCNN